MKRMQPVLWALIALFFLMWEGCQGGCQGVATREVAPERARVLETRVDRIEARKELNSEPLRRKEAHPSDAMAGESGPEVGGERVATSRCQTTSTTITCRHNTAILAVGALQTPRVVYWQTPVGEPPKAGWPVALMFQGSLFSSKLNWSGAKVTPFGAYYQTATLKALLDAGYAVITPVAKGAGTTFWDTNIPPYASAWTLAPDHQFMKKIFADLPQGVFGNVDEKRLYALGISSGGYMTSRMAVAYPGRFRALAIHSASYAHCGGPACWVPTLPKDHPPTLFLHGQLDLVVPINTMFLYRDKLKDQQTPVETEIDRQAAHEWIAAAPTRIISWFQRYP